MIKSEHILTSYIFCRGHHVRRNEQILKHHPLYRQVSVTSSASDEEHCISAYSDPLEVHLYICIYIVRGADSV